MILCAPAYAELLRVDQSFGGLECASCVDAIAKGIQRLRGVESAQVDAKAGAVHVVLREGNRVKIEAIRDAIKATGFTPGDAAIQARGRIGDGKFVIEGTQQAFEIQPPGSEAESGEATAEGIVPASAAGEPLRLRLRSLRLLRPLAP
jgi:copper chaperone CopZ